ncbi:MAG: hypothetical protein UR12_C0029G0010 [candidate division TM6 bacterium GW2011_GWF2_30_66]|nr:MAG: hypothetical protein UR12_C0029G0010 [candidate division TM6 bacterium GW2011_GWF2_30_66]
MMWTKISKLKKSIQVAGAISFFAPDKHRSKYFIYPLFKKTYLEIVSY